MLKTGFGSVTGQRAIKQFLRASLSNDRLSHAYIFEGPKGIGKKTMANAFAGALVCEAGRDDACGDCMGCVLARSGSHPDITKVVCAPDRHSVGVDDIRHVVAEVYLKPYYGKRRVFIIEDTDAMTEQAQNALLKIFEEPPLYAVFILLTANSRQLLETVRSRGLVLTFCPYTADEIEDALSADVPDMRENYDFLKAYSHNNIGRALELALDEGFTAMRSEASGLLAAMLEGSGKSACALAQFSEKHKENADRLFEIIISMLRDIFFLCLGCRGLTVNADMLPLLEAAAKRLTPVRARRALEGAIEANERINRNANYNLAIMTWLCGIWEDAHGRDSRSKV